MGVLTDIAVEGSTYVVTCTFADEEGDAVVPASAVAWRLLNSDAEELSTGSEDAGVTVSIAIPGAEIIISNTTKELHWLTLVVSTTYDSALGLGLALVGTAKFQCKNVLDTP
jgi:hypothetical protein